MKKLLAVLAFALVAAPMFAQDSGWVSLWDGKTFKDWKKAGENPDSFRIEDGAIISNGPRCHLYYVGDYHGAKFKNFELEVDVMTKQGSNGGIYVQTAYQEIGWPLQGFEVQVNNSHTDWRRTGSIYLVDDVKEVPAKDDVWFTERIVVKDNHITTYVDGKKLADWEQPAGWEAPGGMTGRFIQADGGTISFQSHDPKSRVAYKNIRIRLLD